MAARRGEREKRGPSAICPPMTARADRAPKRWRRACGLTLFKREGSQTQGEAATRAVTNTSGPAAPVSRASPGSCVSSKGEHTGMSALGLQLPHLRRAQDLLGSPARAGLRAATSTVRAAPVPPLAATLQTSLRKIASSATSARSASTTTIPLRPHHALHSLSDPQLRPAPLLEPHPQHGTHLSCVAPGTHTARRCPSAPP